jgi:membrane-bound lytic murein transglycosylase B
MKRSLVAGGVGFVVLALLVVLSAAGGRGGRRTTGDVVRTSSPVHPAAGRRAPGALDRARALASEINRAQSRIDDPASSNGELAAAGLLEELATGSVARESPRARHATLALLRPRAAATTRTDLTAGAALSTLTVPRRQFPPWRIVQPPSAGTLLRYFQEAQARFGVGWRYLAAIEFIETRFGRIRGSSPAGAQGPMQFLPATWARYGRGGIDNQRDAILAAARFLVANGAPGDMGTALYHYNNSTAYVAAVQDYVERIRAEPRAYDGYYNWQVLYARARRTFILPVGYPRVRPERVHYP